MPSFGERGRGDRAAVLVPERHRIGVAVATALGIIGRDVGQNPLRPRANQRDVDGFNPLFVARKPVVVADVETVA